MDICRTMPELKTLDDGRQVFCWLYEREEAAALLERQPS
jgi:hypothetical protein